MPDGPAAHTPEYVRERREVPESPRAALRVACGTVGTADDALTAAAVAEVAGAPRRIVERWRAVGDDDTDGWLHAARDTRAWLRPEEPDDPEAPDVERALTRAIAAAERCGRCGMVVPLDVGDGGGLVNRLLPMRCNTRACLECTRVRLRRVMDRWAPVFGAPVRKGYHLAFVTIGSTSPVTTAVQVKRYLRGIGRVVRVMREGSRAFGIPPRSWVAGVRAAEVVPRAVGGFGHVHLAVVRAAFYPYGLHERKLPMDPTPDQLGLRGLLRSIGAGEVFKDETVTSGSDDPADGARAVAKYMGKVARYMSKVSGELDQEAVADTAAALTWDGRRDILSAMRGVRLVQPFGDALGLLAGPDRVRMTEYELPVRMMDRGTMYDPIDPDTWGHLGPDAVYGGLAVEDIPLAARPDWRRTERVTHYRADTLATWGSWCDVGLLKRAMLTEGGAAGASTG